MILEQVMETYIRAEKIEIINELENDWICE
jgi:hypothetical protein